MNKNSVRVLLGCGMVCLLISLVSRTMEPKSQMYSVAFETNGGRAEDSQLVQENAKVTKPANPTKAGYTLLAGTQINRLLLCGTLIRQLQRI